VSVDEAGLGLPACLYGGGARSLSKKSIRPGIGPLVRSHRRESSPILPVSAPVRSLSCARDASISTSKHFFDRLLGQEKEITLAVESVDVTSDVFEVRVFVSGILSEPWIPLLALGLGWNEADLSFIGVEKDPSLGSSSRLTSILQENKSQVIVVLQYRGRCVGAIVPECSQPVLVFTFAVTSVFAESLIGLIRVQMFFRRRITLPLRRLGAPLACS